MQTIHFMEIGLRVVKLCLAPAVPAISLWTGAKETNRLLYFLAWCHPLAAFLSATRRGI